MRAEYPKRPAYFSQRFIRLMVKSAAAQTIGTDAFALLAVIATTEDARRYAGPVAYFNEQLMMLLGIGSKERFVSARARAIESGWLAYSKGRKGIAGLYFVLTPSELDQIPDGPSDESGGTFRSETEPKVNQQIEMPFDSRTESRRKPDGNPSSNIPSPIPIPKESTRSRSSFDASQVELPSRLDNDAFKAAWLDWCEHRREIGKPLKPTSTKQLLAELADMGTNRAVAAVRHTIAKGWQGIREPDSQGTPTNGKPKPEHRSFESRKA